MRGPGGEFELPFDEAVFGGPARNERRHYWIKREGEEPVLVSHISKFAGKDRATQEQHWEDVPAGSCGGRIRPWKWFAGDSESRLPPRSPP
jgi:hypothetical protein